MTKKLEKWQVFLLGGLVFIADIQLMQFIGIWDGWVLAGLALLLSLVTAGVIWKAGFLTKKNIQPWWKQLLAVGLGLFGIYFFKFLGAIILIAEHGVGHVPANQQAIMDAKMPLQLLFTFVVLTAPVVEEFIMRGLIMGKVFTPQSIWGLLLSSVLFGLIHGPTDIGSWVLYGGMGLALGLTYRYTERLDLVIALHALNNLIGFFLMVSMT